MYERCYINKVYNIYFLLFIRWGLKSYVAAESSTGYIWGLRTYSGQGNKLDELIPFLLGDLANKGYHLYMDNFYNSVQRCDLLLGLGTHVCGTIRRQRGEPEALKKYTVPTQLKENERLSRHNGEGVLMTVWRDGKKLVRMVSTIHEDQEVEVSERQKGQAAPLRRLKPVAVAEYNRYMNGVDRMDQRIAYYPFTRRSVRWSLKYTFYMFQLCFANAFVVYRAKGGKLTNLLDFMLELVESWTTVPAAVREAEEAEEDEDVQPQHPIPKYATKEDREGRLMPQFHGHVLQELPDKGPQGKDNPRRLCRVHERNRTQGHLKKKISTRWWCPGCNVPLCPAPCYFVYHSDPDYEHCFDGGKK